jgi:hypothetical protein
VNNSRGCRTMHRFLYNIGISRGSLKNFTGYPHVVRRLVTFFLLFFLDFQNLTFNCHLFFISRLSRSSSLHAFSDKRY